MSLSMRNVYIRTSVHLRLYVLVANTLHDISSFYQWIFAKLFSLVHLELTVFWGQRPRSHYCGGDVQHSTLSLSSGFWLFSVVLGGFGFKYQCSWLLEATCPQYNYYILSRMQNFTHWPLTQAEWPVMVVWVTSINWSEQPWHLLRTKQCHYSPFTQLISSKKKLESKVKVRR